ncbi:MAG: TldD/PmbA family protein [Snowella sp.]|nr:TldD/PmbA family protein [Snowella sp.]
MSHDLEQLLTLARQAGAEAAEVYYSRSLSHPVFFEANRLKQLESSESDGTALRLWREGCPGLAVAYGPADPQALVDKAITLSHLNPPETPELNEAHTAIYPTVGESLEVQTLIDMGKTAIAQIRDQYPEVLCSGELECEEDTTLLMNSKGLHCQYSDIAISYYFGVEWIRGEDFLAVYDGEYSRGKLQPDQIVQQLLQRLAWAKTNATATTGKVPVLFTPNAATLLWGTVVSALSGKRVQEKSSPWSDKIGQNVLADCLTLYQDPTLSPYDCPFDDEGTATQVLPLITQGRIEQFYSDRTTARLLGGQSTGNGFRPGLGNYPTPSLVNLIVEPGEGSLMDLIGQIDNGLLIDQSLGGGPDISGDFSINVDLGYRIEKGQIVGRVKDTMIAGNVYSLLKQILALGSDRQWNGSCYTPSLLIEDLSVVGGNF